MKETSGEYEWIQREESSAVPQKSLFFLFVPNVLLHIAYFYYLQKSNASSHFSPIIRLNDFILYLQIVP